MKLFATLTAATLATTLPVSAEGLGGISGWQPPTQVCGATSFFPVLFQNNTDTVQTASITIAPHTSGQVHFGSDSGSVASAAGCNRPVWGYNPGQFQQNITVQPGQTDVYYMAIGGKDYNLIGAAHSFAIGGLPSGTSGASWYDFGFSLNVDESFQNLWAYYSNTGGTASNNGQNGFAVAQCNTSNTPGGGQTVTVGSKVITPWSSNTYNTPGQTQFNQPLCFTWGS
jgi:hypothetical protein